MVCRRAGSLSFVLVSLVGAFAWAQGEASAPGPDAAFVRAAIELTASKVESWQADVQRYLSLKAFDADLSQMHVSSTYSFAFKGDKAYSDFQDFTTSGEVVIDEKAAYDGKIARVYFPQQSEGYVRQQFLKDDKKLRPAPFLIQIWNNPLIECIQKDTLTLKPAPVDVQGAKCLVLHGQDAEAPTLAYNIYVDSSKGYMPLQIEELTTSDGKETLRAVRRLMEYREVKPGIWFPGRIEEEGWGKDGAVLNRNVYLVQNIAVNEPVSDDRFVITFLARTLVDDEIAGVQYRVSSLDATSGGGSSDESAESMATASAAPPSRGIAPKSDPGHAETGVRATSDFRRWWWKGVGGVAITLALVVTWSYLRRKRAGAA